MRFASVIGLLALAVTGLGCVHHLPTQGWITLIDGNSGMDNWYKFRKLLVKEL